MIRMTFAVLVVATWLLAAVWLVLAISQAALDHTVLRPCLVATEMAELRC